MPELLAHWEAEAGGLTAASLRRTVLARCVLANHWPGSQDPSSALAPDRVRGSVSSAAPAPAQPLRGPGLRPPPGRAVAGLRGHLSGGRSGTGSFLPEPPPSAHEEAATLAPAFLLVSFGVCRLQWSQLPGEQVPLFWPPDASE